MSKASKKAVKADNLYNAIRMEQGRGRYINAKEMALIEDRIRDKAIEQATLVVVVALANILWHDWGKLQKKGTRLKAYMELINGYMYKVDQPTEKMKECEKALWEQAGYLFARRAQQ